MDRPGTGPRTADPAGARRTAIGVQFVGHATVLLELNGVRVLTDPFLRGRLGPLERHGPVPDLDALGPVDVIVVSHGHPDHFDLASLGAVGGRPLVVVPHEVQEVGEVAQRLRHLLAGDLDEPVVHPVAGEAVTEGSSGLGMREWGELMAALGRG